MSRLKKIQQTKREVKESQGQRTLVKRLRKLGLGRTEVRIISAELVKGKEHLTKLVIEAIEDGRKGVFIIPNNGYAMDTLVNAIYGDDEQELYLEELIDKEVIVEVVRNNRYLNIDYFEPLNLEIENEETEEDLDLDLSDIEFEEDYELEENLEELI